MTKEDFTAEFVLKKLLPYILNHDYPHDEMLEIGGTHARMTGLSDLEVVSVQQAEAFIVAGRASLDATVDLGEGQHNVHSFPMRFAYAFDEEGNVNGRIQREIDTSSFFEGGPA